MSSSRLVRAMAVGKLIIVNNELSSVGVELMSTNPDGSTRKWVATIKPKQTLDVSKVCSIDDIRRNTVLQNTIVRRKITVIDTWSEKDE